MELKPIKTSFLPVLNTKKWTYTPRLSLAPLSKFVNRKSNSRVRNLPEKPSALFNPSIKYRAEVSDIAYNNKSAILPTETEAGSNLNCELSTVALETMDRTTQLLPNELITDSPFYTKVRAKLSRNNARVKVLHNIKARIKKEQKSTSKSVIENYRTAAPPLVSKKVHEGPIFQHKLLQDASFREFRVKNCDEPMTSISKYFLTKYYLLHTSCSKQERTEHEIKSILEWLRDVKTFRKWTKKVLHEFMHYSECKVLERHDQIKPDRGLYVVVQGDLKTENEETVLPSKAACQEDEYLDLKKVHRLPISSKLTADKRTVLIHINVKNMRYILKEVDVLVREDALEAMKSQALFKEYPAEILQQLARRCVYKTKKKGTVIVRKEQELESLYLISEGTLEAFATVEVEQSYCHPIGKHEWKVKKVRKRFKYSLGKLAQGALLGFLELLEPEATYYEVSVTSDTCSFYQIRIPDSLREMLISMAPDDVMELVRIFPTVAEIKSHVEFSFPKGGRSLRSVTICSNSDSANVTNKTVIVDRKSYLK